MDKWVPSAGRSKVLENQGLVWVRVEGIPLHLLSSELLSHIGECCGGFIEASSAACHLGSALIKVRRGKEIPASLFLRFGNEVYEVLLAVVRRPATLVGTWGVDYLPPPPALREGSRPTTVLQLGTRRKWNLEVGQGSGQGGVGNTSEEEVCRPSEEAWVGAQFSMSDFLFDDFLGATSNSDESETHADEAGSTLVIETGLGDKTPSVSLPLCQLSFYEKEDPVCFSGLRLGTGSGLNIFVSKESGSNEWAWEILLGSLRSWVISPWARVERPVFPSPVLCQDSMDRVWTRMGEAISVNGPRKAVPWLPAKKDGGRVFLEQAEVGSGDLVVSDERDVEPRGEAGVPRAPLSLEQMLVEDSVKVADLIGLSLGGSVAAARVSVSEAAVAVGIRRKKGRSSSRLERELKRLGASGETVVDDCPVSRSTRCVVPFDLSNDP
ncbi:hypothetical protein LINGRAHAP2_LOCUS9938 [Linum grandiflorum]